VAIERRRSNLDQLGQRQWKYATLHAFFSHVTRKNGEQLALTVLVVGIMDVYKKIIRLPFFTFSITILIIYTRPISWLYRPFTGLICSSVLCFSSIFFCFSYSYVRQIKLASCLVNVWVHN